MKNYPNSLFDVAMKRKLLSKIEKTAPEETA